MAMEDRYGHATRTTPGTVVETSDGRKITTQSDEVARLHSLINQGHEGG